MRWCLALLCSALASAGPARADSQRLALVIGNATYAGLPAIPACAASVSVVSAALRRAGFDVTERLNPSNGRMGSAITEFGDAIARNPGAIAVAYACGYAVAFEGRVFLLPASASLERDTDALTQGVVARLLTGTVLNSDARAGLVLLDTLAKPGGGGPLPLSTLAQSPPEGRGFAAVHSTRGLPDGATPLAAAFAAGIAPRDAELRALLAEMRTVLGAPAGATVVVQGPTARVPLGAPSGVPVGAAGLGVAAVPVPVAPSLPASVPAASDPAGPELAMPVPAAPSPAVGAPAAAPAPAPSTPAPSTPASSTPASSTPGPSTPATPAPSALGLTELDRRRVQLALQRLGYFNGKVTGVYNADSVAAIRRYQRDLGFAATGKLTADQAAQLLADGR